MAKKTKSAPKKKSFLVVVVLFLAAAGFFAWQWGLSFKKINNLSRRVDNLNADKEQVKQSCRKEMASWQERFTASENSRMIIEKERDSALASIKAYHREVLLKTFFNDQIKNGDNILDWKVESVRPFLGTTTSFQIGGDKPANLSVVFSGEAVISGQTTCVAAENVGNKGECGAVCLSNIDLDSQSKIPRLTGDEKDLVLCFDSESFSKNGWPMNPEPEQKKVGIKDLTLNYNSAGEIVHVVKLEKDLSK